MRISAVYVSLLVLFLLLTGCQGGQAKTTDLPASAVLNIPGLDVPKGQDTAHLSFSRLTAYSEALPAFLQLADPARDLLLNGSDSGWIKLNDGHKACQLIFITDRDPVALLHELVKALRTNGFGVTGNYFDKNTRKMIDEYFMELDSNNGRQRIHAELLDLKNKDKVDTSSLGPTVKHAYMLALVLSE